MQNAGLVLLRVLGQRGLRGGEVAVAEEHLEEHCVSVEDEDVEASGLVAVTRIPREELLAVVTVLLDRQFD